MRQPPRSTRTDTSFPTRRSSDLRRARRSDRSAGGRVKTTFLLLFRIQGGSIQAGPGGCGGACNQPVAGTGLPSHVSRERHTDVLQAYFQSIYGNAIPDKIYNGSGLQLLRQYLMPNQVTLPDNLHYTT